jgi:hypothetical protein
MISDRDLMRLHVEALFTHDERGDLVVVNEPGGRAAPRLFIGLTLEGTVLRFRHDVADDLRTELKAEYDHAQPHMRDLASRAAQSRYEAVLVRSGSVERTWAGPAFCFPEVASSTVRAVAVTEHNADVLRPLLEEWIPDVELWQPMTAMSVSGVAVAVCGSVRRTAAAHEAGVETASQYRRAGYASQAVSAWAAAVRDIGRVPLYSTSWHNEASLALARRLCLRSFGSDLHIT